MDLVEELVLSVQDINIAITTEIKSKDSTSKLLQKSKLIDFFKCLEVDCEFTTNESDGFVSHLSSHQVTAFCCYCLYGCLTPKDLVDHMVRLHGKRKFQCSSCLYRAISHTHVQTHISNVHPESFVLSCPNTFSVDGSGTQTQDYSQYLIPYECILEDCDFATMSTDQYQSHAHHHAHYVCHICGEELHSSEDLVDHHLMHNIGVFQCPYCIFGAAQQDQILSHESLFHADLPLLVFNRNYPPSNNGEAAHVSMKRSSKGQEQMEASDTEGDTPDTVMSMLLNPQMSIEVDDTRYEVGEHQNKNMAALGGPSNMAALGGPSNMAASVPGNSGSLMTNYMRFIDKMASQQQPQQPQALGLGLYAADSASLLNFQNSLNELQCNLCLATTKDFNAMKRHLLSLHNVTAMFSCAYCQEAGQTQDKIKIHIKKRHPRQLIKIQKMYSPKAYFFNCPFCQFGTDKKLSFKTHMCSELGGCCYLCLLCKAQFSQKKKVVQHLQECHGSSGRGGEEKQLRSYGEDKEAMKSRVETILPILSKMLFPVKSKDPLEEQEESEDITVFSVHHFTCPECSERFRLPLELSQHMKLSHIYVLTRRFVSEEGDAMEEEAGQKALTHIEELVEGQKHDLIDKLIKVHNISLFTDNRPEAAQQDSRPTKERKSSRYWGEVINLSDDDESTASAENKTEEEGKRQTARKSIPASSTRVQCGICDTLFPTMLEAKRHHEANHEDQELLLLQRCQSSPVKAEEKPCFTFYGKSPEQVDIDNLYICLSDEEEEEEKTKLEDFIAKKKKKLQPKIILQSFLHFL